MFIEAVIENAERKLLTFVDKIREHHYSWGAMYFKSSQLPTSLVPEVVVSALNPVLTDNPAAVYFFRNGDIAICWSGAHKGIEKAVYVCFYERIVFGALKDIETYYDLQASTDAESLRDRCEQMIKQQEREAAAKRKASFEAAPEQVMMFAAIAKGRALRANPEVLIVEDQLFSAQMLSKLLEPLHKTYIAANAETAWDIYLKYAPDIVFLDVEMPGTNGHKLANIIRQFDKDAYIIMVTASHAAEDIATARSNRVNGYIVKPYGKNKIVEAIDKYKTDKKSHR